MPYRSTSGVKCLSSDNLVQNEQLDGYVDAILAGRTTIAQVVSKRPELEIALSERLPSEAMRRFSATDAHPDFRTTLLEQLLEVEVGSSAPSSRLKSLRLPAKIILVAALFAFLLAGMGIAATASKPGSPLYPIKRIMEKVGLSEHSNSAKTSSPDAATPQAQEVNDKNRVDIDSRSKPSMQKESAAHQEEAFSKADKNAQEKPSSPRNTKEGKNPAGASSATSPSSKDDDARSDQPNKSGTKTAPSSSTGQSDTREGNPNGNKNSGGSEGGSGHEGQNPGKKGNEGGQQNNQRPSKDKNAGKENNPNADKKSDEQQGNQNSSNDTGSNDESNNTSNGKSNGHKKS